MALKNSNLIYVLKAVSICSSYIDKTIPGVCKGNNQGEPGGRVRLLPRQRARLAWRGGVADYNANCSELPTILKRLLLWRQMLLPAPPHYPGSDASRGEFRKVRPLPTG